jgi:DNA-binding GntR family transcriptional regulator
MRAMNMTAKAAAYVYLKKQILSGALCAGSRINPAFVAKALGLSRVPVREAILQLEGEGLIAISPNRRPKVINLTSGDVLELFEIRVALETLAIGKAALRITARELGELRAHIERMERVASSPKRWLELHDAFHDRIYKAADMPRLLAEIRRIRQAIHPYLLMYISLHDSPEIPGQEHSSLLRTLESRDSEMSSQALAQHIRRGAAELIYVFIGGKAEGSINHASEALLQKSVNLV